MSKHTPSPWVWMADELDHVPIDIRTYKSPGFYANAELRGESGDPVIVCGEYDVLGFGESRIPNALLLAAAPDLLAALQGFVLNEKQINDPQFEGVQERLMALARAAIAKAEGSPCR